MSGVELKPRGRVVGCFDDVCVDLVSGVELRPRGRVVDYFVLVLWRFREDGVGYSIQNRSEIYQYSYVTSCFASFGARTGLFLHMHMVTSLKSRSLLRPSTARLTRPAAGSL